MLPDIKQQKINSEFERLKNEHDEIFNQFLKKQVPLNGVLQKGLLGKPEAFPLDILDYRHKEFDPDEPKAVLVVESIGDNKLEVIKIVRSAAGLTLKEAKVLVESRSPFTITVPESRAALIQSILEKAGATVER